MMMPTSGESRSPVRALKRLAGALLAAARLRGSFSASKCKTEARMAAARMKLLKNRQEAQVRKMRGDIAALLRDGREDTARIRVEHVIREENTMAANEIIELFCELIVTRLPIIAKQKECPADMKEGICSLIFAAPRCSELPELSRMSDLFEKKYGKDFVAAAVDLRPNASVNNLLIEKLSVNKPSGQTKLKILKDIAKEHQIDWDTTETEQDLLKPHEELIKGPNTFVEASKMPVKTTLSANFVQLNPSNYRSEYANFVQPNPSNYRSEYDDAESAAQAASAAKAAADLVNRNTHSSNEFDDSEAEDESYAHKRGSSRKVHSEVKFDKSGGWNSEAENESDAEIQSRQRPPPRRERYQGNGHSDEKEPDDDFPEPPKANPASRVHPSMPLDFETLTARIEALRSSVKFA